MMDLKQKLPNLKVSIFDLLPLLPILGRHASLLQTLTNMTAEVEELYNEVMPAVNTINASLNKHQPMVAKIQELTPEIQQLLTEALPYIQRMK